MAAACDQAIDIVDMPTAITPRMRNIILLLCSMQTAAALQPEASAGVVNPEKPATPHTKRLSNQYAAVLLP
jgi:hypothetical protein